MKLKVFQKMYDFTIWMTNHTTKYPKSQRFSFAVRIENLMLEILSLIIVANKKRNKTEYIKEIDIKLEELRILIRISKDLKLINLKSYKYAVLKLEEIGKLLGGWWKSIKQGDKS